jgi:hypothetical protein
MTTVNTLPFYPKMKITTVKIFIVQVPVDYWSLTTERDIFNSEREKGIFVNFFLVKRVPGQGPKQRESDKTGLYPQIIIILISLIIIYYY